VAGQLLSALTAFLGVSTPTARAAAKDAVLSSLAGLNRGVSANTEQQAAVEAAVRKLERLNPTRPNTLASPLLNGKWELIYTTSVSILGSNRPPFLRPLGASAAVLSRKVLAHPCGGCGLLALFGTLTRAPSRCAGPIYQTIDAPRKRAKNQETWPFFSSVTAELTPTSKASVGVQFKTFRLLGFIPVTAPEAAKGSLSFTYVDEELRISRGDKVRCACIALG
jgi:PAP_fibrillin